MAAKKQNRSQAEANRADASPAGQSLKEQIPAEQSLTGRSLTEIRAEIDGIDAQMAELFEKRMELCREAGKVKTALGKAIEDRAREAEIVARNAEKIADTKVREQYKRFQETVISISKELQQDMQPEGSGNKK